MSAIQNIHPTNLEIIKLAYDKIFKAELLPSYWGIVELAIDEFGFIDKKTIANLIGEDINDADDSWIINMTLNYFDYEVHHGVEKFRPLSLRGKVSSTLNDQWKNRFTFSEHISNPFLLKKQELQEHLDEIASLQKAKDKSNSHYDAVIEREKKFIDNLKKTCTHVDSNGRKQSDKYHNVDFCTICGMQI